MGSFVKKRLFAVEFIIPPPVEAVGLDLGDTVVTRIIEAVSEQDAALDIMAKFPDARVVSSEPWSE